MGSGTGGTGTYTWVSTACHGRCISKCHRSWFIVHAVLDISRYMFKAVAAAVALAALAAAALAAVVADAPPLSTAHCPRSIIHGLLFMPYRSYPVTCSGQLLQQLLLLLLLLLPLLLSSPTRRRCPRRIAHGPWFMIYCSCRVGLSATPSNKLHCPRVAARCCPACSSISHCHAEMELAQGVTCGILDSCVAVCVRSHLASCRLVELPCSP